MNNIEVKNSNLTVSEIGLGCMRIADMSVSDVSKLVGTSIDCGINFFDHADIYGGGKSEEVFAKAVDMSSSNREKMILQSKCGIRNGFFDSSKEHIVDSVDAILKRLNTDYLDSMLLHRPDALVEPEEVAAAFDALEKSGKVKSFGISNHNPMQIELLKKSVNQSLVFNQLQLSVKRSGMIDSGLNVNMKVDNSVDHDGSVLDYCRLNDITIQAWSPFQFGFFEGVFLNNSKFPELNSYIDTLADKYGVTNSAIAVAWILRHLSKIQTLIGTTKRTRVKDMCKASTFKLSREEWYKIYTAAGNILP